MKRAYLAIFAVLLLGMSPYTTKSGRLKPIAVVNGEPISREDFDLAMGRFKATEADLSEAKLKTVEKTLADLLVSEALFQQFLRRNVTAPDPSLVERRIKELETSLKAKKKTLAAYLRDAGQTEARLRGDIVATIQWNAYVHKHATDNELKKYFDENRDLVAGATMTGRHIVLAWPDSPNPTARAAVVKRIEAIRGEILNGVDFAEVAKKHSKDSGVNFDSGMQFGAPRPNDPDPAIRTISNLKVGEVSPIIQTETGCFLVQLTDKKAGVPVEFEKVKDDVRLLWADELREQILAQERRTAKIEMNLP